MAEDNVHLVLFKEGELDHTAEALTRLRTAGIADQDISVISGVPYSERMLGRPMSWSRITLIGMAGAVVGVGMSLALNWGTPLLYPIHVGGLPLLPIPTTIVLTFEFAMLGLMVATFLGVVLETISPSYGPKGYHPKVTDGYIGILFTCPPGMDDRIHSEMTGLGAEVVHGSEVKQ